MREKLRRRNNVTTCRCLPRGAEQPLQNPRQREFLRRRNLASDAGRTPWRQEPEEQIPPDSSSRVEPRPTVLLQNSWSCPTFPPARSHLSIPLGSPADAIPGQGDSVNTQGTQTFANPREGVKDSSQQTDCGIAVFNKVSKTQEMVQLSNYLKEALHRELLLKQKMVILQELFSTLLEASEKSWQGQLNEDKLKCKLRALENQLQACTQSYSKECVKKILIEMEDQKQTYEQKAKEALQKMLEDKLQTEQQLQNSQRSLAAMREDLAFWKEHDTALKAELTKVTTAHTELKDSFHSLQSELQRADAQTEQLRQALQSLQGEHAALHQHANALRQDNDLKAEHISAMEDQVFTTQTQPLTPAKEKQNTLLEHQEEEEKEEKEEEEGEDSLKDEVQERTSQLTAKENECSELRSELEALSGEYHSCLTRLRQCRDELNRFHGQQAKRQHGHWIPLLVALTAVAIATFLASYRP
ncbi:TRAF3 interacting protein 3 [Willisornis vidua]|uniref:TRAF3 interacting protein 3 n=1 Tax=Willisornis vidua TaxID=1566151 RepID=A0ABQ9DY95_9PASS|nr:TRAF3 interacting protein 3 [Willisornis vidua]